tara:strand:- start:373 stop:720 length:348 start_codon:yes stop_codon:yes gene_type:complete
VVNQDTSKDTCPHCVKGKVVTDNESGVVICSRCGFIISEKLESCPKCNGTEIGRYSFGIRYRIPEIRKDEGWEDRHSQDAASNPYVRILGSDVKTGDEPSHFCLDCGYSWNSYKF